jgi:phosphomevalonate kinase
MTPVGATAPGKALLCGEYAVLEGAQAIVATVDRRVSVVWRDRPGPMPPEIEATLARAQAELGPVPGSLALDASDLQHDRVKLGLGSSAAAAVAAAGAVFATHGHELGDPETLQRVFTCAFEGHGSIAPQGSGVDVAASTFGGFLRFARRGTEVDIRALECPDELVIRLVWTGHAARTSELVNKVHGLRRDDSGSYRACMDRLSEISGRFASAFETGSPAEIVAEAASYANAMGALGEAAGAPIVDARLGRAAELATRFSGSAKPCGAGGGDVAIAFFLDPHAAKGFEVACKAEGLHPIDVSWGAAGVQARSRGGAKC